MEREKLGFGLKAANHHFIYFLFFYNFLKSF